MALPPLLVKIGADATGLDKGLSASQASLAKFAKVGVAAAGAVGVAMIALTKESMAQIDAQAKLAQSMGTTVKSMQALQLAGSLAGVAMSGVQQATSDLTRRLAQAASGTGPVADALDRLGLSAVALSQVPLDERVLKINEALDAMVPAAQRAAVAGQLFGEEGSLAMARIDTATIRQAREDIVRFGVATSEVGANQVEAANDAVTRLGLAFTGLGNQMATAAAPAIERFANGLVDLAARIMGVKVSLDEYFATLQQARQVLGEDVFSRLVGKPEEIIKAAPALQAVADETNRLSGIALNAQNEIGTLIAGLDSIGEEGAASAVQVIADQMEKLRQEFANGDKDVDEFIDGMQGLQDRAVSVAERIAEINGIDLSGIVGRIQSVGTALANAAAQAINLTQNLPGAVSTQIGPSSRRGTRAGTTGLAPTTSLRPQLPGVDFGEDPEAQGGGLKDEFARRLEILMEGLQTERETLQAWYDEGLEVLQTARERELLTEAEYWDQKTKLQSEYNQRSKSLMNEEVQMRKSTFSSLIGLLTQFGSKNKALAKVAVALNAAQRISEISANTAAASTRALAELGPIAGPPVAARIAAYGMVQKGIAAASAALSMKGVGGSSGSVGGIGSSAGEASTASATPQQQSVQTLNFSVTSDPFGISDRLVRQIVGAINQSQRDGSTLIRATVS
jgi:hypothetical protein